MAETMIDPAWAEDYPPNIQAILRKPSPASAFLGLELVAFDREAGLARMAFHAGEQLCNKWGGLHGGMVAAMLDDAISIAMGLAVEWGEITPTFELKTSFIAVGRPGRLEAIGQVVKRGGSVGFVEARLWDAEANLIATASATLGIRKHKR
ncbi:MAG: PaaI family thioesterase [Alphaproteobacteria bacterium]